MFEVAELGRTVSRQEFDEAVPGLRSALLEAQFALKGRKIPVIVIVSGADCAGKGEFVHRLNEWLDPRGVDTHAFSQCTDEEQARPRFWRFWRALPARGRIGIFFGSWYSEPMVGRVYREIKASELDGELDRIAFFEKMLAEDGALIVKFWFHLSKKEQARRLKNLQRDPHTRHGVGQADRRNLKLYERFIKTSERVIRRTDSAPCPWHLIEATDRRYRELAGRADPAGGAANPPQGWRGGPGPGNRRAGPPPPRARAKSGETILDHVDLTQKLTGRRYGEELEKYQGRLTRLTWEAHVKKISTVAVFEGWDAAGKGSAIRRVTEAIDPRLYRIIPIAAPTDDGAGPPLSVAVLAASSPGRHGGHL